MANPLATLRKYQVAFFVFFGVVCMLVFVIGDPLDTWLRSRAGGPRQENKVVVTWTGGQLREQELGYQQQVRNVIREFMRQLLEETQRKNGFPRVQVLTLSPSEEDIVFTHLLAQRAGAMGMVVSEEMALTYLDQLTANLIPRSGIGSIFRESVGGRITEQQLLEEIKLELLAQNYLSLTYPDLTQGQLPVQSWEYHCRLNRQITAEVLPVRVADFKSKVTKEPTDAEIAALYAEAKDRYPDPASPNPGFRRPRKIAFDFVRADRKKLEQEETEKLKPGVTDQEIQEYYDKNKTEFRIPDPAAPAMPADKGSPGEPSAPGPADSGKPVPDKPAAENAVPDKPAADKPAADKPAADKPAADKPAADKPAADKPAADKPAADKPAGDKPAAEKPVEERAAPDKAPDKAPAPEKPDRADDAAKPSGDETAQLGGVPRSDAEVGDSETEDSEAGEAEQGEETGTSGDVADAGPAVSRESDVPQATSAQQEASAPEKTSGEVEKSSDTTSPGAAKAPSAAKEPGVSEASDDPDTKKSSPDGGSPAAGTQSVPAAGPSQTGAEPVAGPAGAAAAVPVPSEPQYKPLDDALRAEIRERVAKQKAAQAAQQRIDAGFTEITAAVERYARQWQSAELAGKPVPAAPNYVELAGAHAMTFDRVPLSDPTQVQAVELGKTRGYDFSQGSFEPIPFHVLAYRDGISLWKPDQIRGGAAEGNPDIEFLYWKTKEESPFVPELKAIRDEVVDVWKLQQAVGLAEAEAQSLAERVRKGGQPMKEFFAGDPAVKVADTNSFSWMTRGFLPVNMGGTPSLSSVDNVEHPGSSFMKTVFGLRAGEVGTAVNQSRSVVYVVRLASETPSEDALREQFLQTGGSQDLRQLAVFDRLEIRQGWLESLRREFNVQWSRSPQS